MAARMFDRSLRLMAVGACVGAILSCREGLQRSDPLIYGGRPAPDAWPSTIALLSYQTVACTGVAVHPRLVITAAHCVENADEDFDIYLGLGMDNSPLSGQIRAERIVVSPRYGPSPQGYHDIAYIVLKDPLPLSQSEIIPMVKSEEEIAQILKRGLNATIVGFGQREDASLGSKYAADVTLTNIDADEVSMGGDGRDACSGDSGGPAFARLDNGEWRVFGIVSRGRACGKGGIWSRIDASLCWIQASSGIDLEVDERFCS